MKNSIPLLTFVDARYIQRRTAANFRREGAVSCKQPTELTYANSAVPFRYNETAPGLFERHGIPSGMAQPNVGRDRNNVATKTRHRERKPRDEISREKQLPGTIKYTKFKRGELVSASRACTRATSPQLGHGRCRSWIFGRLRSGSQPRASLLSRVSRKSESSCGACACGCCSVFVLNVTVCPREYWAS